MSGVRDWPDLRLWAAETLGLALPDPTADRLRRYIDILRFWNRKVALVSQRDLPSILVKHVADSLVAAVHCDAARRIADLGSGAGFPGLVIALLRPEAHVTLIEARGRKVSFLEEACRTAAIANAQVVHARIEVAAAAAEHAASYDLITSRALADLAQVVALAHPLGAPGARVLCMRAADAPVPPEAQVHRYLLPDGTPRQLTLVTLAR